MVDRDKDDLVAWVGKITNSKALSTSTFTFPTQKLEDLSQSTCSYATFRIQCVIDGAAHSTDFTISTNQL